MLFLFLTDFNVIFKPYMNKYFKLIRNIMIINLLKKWYHKIWHWPNVSIVMLATVKSRHKYLPVTGILNNLAHIFNEEVYKSIVSKSSPGVLS